MYPLDSEISSLRLSNKSVLAHLTSTKSTLASNITVRGCTSAIPILRATMSIRASETRVAITTRAIGRNLQRSRGRWLRGCSSSARRRGSLGRCSSCGCGRCWSSTIPTRTLVICGTDSLGVPEDDVGIDGFLDAEKFVVGALTVAEHGGVGGAEFGIHVVEVGAEICGGAGGNGVVEGVDEGGYGVVPGAGCESVVLVIY